MDRKHKAKAAIREAASTSIHMGLISAEGIDSRPETACATRRRSIRLAGSPAQVKLSCVVALTANGDLLLRVLYNSKATDGT